MRSFTLGLEISASGLRAQRVRMNIIASNLANMNTTRTPEGGPYKRKEVVFWARPIGWAGMFWPRRWAGMWGIPSFMTFLWPKIPVPVDSVLSEAKVWSIVEDPRPSILKYDPYHPDADESGYVAYPNINPVEEMVNMISAQRAYDANVTAMNATKDMALRALEIGRA